MPVHGCVLTSESAPVTSAVLTPPSSSYTTYYVLTLLLTSKSAPVASAVLTPPSSSSLRARFRLLFSSFAWLG